MRSRDALRRLERRRRSSPAAAAVASEFNEPPETAEAGRARTPRAGFATLPVTPALNGGRRWDDPERRRAREELDLWGFDSRAVRLDNDDAAAVAARVCRVLMGRTRS